MTEPELSASLSEKDLLFRIARDIRAMRTDLTKVINYMIEAESEVSEKMRRFIMYMHDLHDVSYMYEERGIEVPQHVRLEMQRVDDRFRQLLQDAHSDTGTFEKVRQDMVQRGGNRWDHQRLFPKQETKNDPGQSDLFKNGVD